MDCDRRLSRAARSVLLEKTLVVFSHHFKNSSKAKGNPLGHGNNADNEIGNYPRRGKNVDELLFLSDKMKWFNIALRNTMTQPQKCVLNMDSAVDIFWEIDHFNIYHGIQFVKVKRRNAFTCTVCQRKFSSMFYLDLHFQNHHFHQLVQDSERKGQKIICPAQDLCQVLGELTCHLEALKNEPYYSRGDLFEITFKDVATSISSNKVGPISEYEMQLAKAVKRNYEREIMDIACNDGELEKSRLYCLEAMNDCFGGGDTEGINQTLLLRDMQNTLCQPKTCLDYLADIRKNGRIKQHENVAHLIKHEWDEHMLHFHQYDMRIGVGFIISLLFLIIYVSWMGGFNYFNRGFSVWFIKKRRRTFDHNLQKKAKKLD